MSNMDIQDFENIPGTWANELKNHWEAFSSVCWIAFNAACDEMCEKGHENKISKYKWREYVLSDMQRRHDEENEDGS